MVIGHVSPDKIFDVQDVVKSYDGLTCKVCVPTYTLLLAVGNPTVDLFVLDIEGAEMPVVKSIPLNEANFTSSFFKHM